MPNPRVIEVSSTSALDRGRQYGAAAADLIAGAIAYYRAGFQRQAGLSWAGALAHGEPWRLLIERDFPELLEEMAGIAEGAGVELAEIVALNCRGEIMYDNWFARADEKDLPREIDGCTSFSLTEGAAGDGHVYAGQNWDWRHAIRDTVVVLRVVQPPKPTLVMQLEAGQIGRHGANSHGLALNANGLGGRFDDSVGMPQTVIRRAVLDAANIADAVKTLTWTKAHIPSNALLTHRDGFSIDVETTPDGHGWLYPDDAGILVHGNHYQAFVPPATAGQRRPMSPDSLIRVPRARRGLAKATGAEKSVDVRTAIHSAMSDHLGHPDSLCTHPDERMSPLDQWSTTVSSCVDLTTGDYYLAPGSPCEHPYELMPFNLYDVSGSV
jgi:isopenicillin-N N-acyltransferase like protein